MKTFLPLVALLAASAAQADVTTFKGSFAAEISGATGSGALTLVHDSGSHTLQIDASFAGLSGITTVAHIHCCTAAPNTGTASVALATAGNLPGWPQGVNAGSYSRLIDLADPSSFNANFVTASGGSAAAAETRLIDNLKSGNAYFNIHSNTYSGGEIRAFVTAVPEPETYALMLAGLAGVGFAARRRKA